MGTQSPSEEAQGQEGVCHNTGEPGHQCFAFLPRHPGLLVCFQTGNGKVSHPPVQLAGPAAPCLQGKQMPWKPEWQ